MTKFLFAPQVALALLWSAPSTWAEAQRLAPQQGPDATARVQTSTEWKIACRQEFLAALRQVNLPFPRQRESNGTTPARLKTNKYPTLLREVLL